MWFLPILFSAETRALLMKRKVPYDGMGNLSDFFDVLICTCTKVNMYLCELICIDDEHCNVRKL